MKTKQIRLIGILLVVVATLYGLRLVLDRGSGGSLSDGQFAFLLEGEVSSVEVKDLPRTIVLRRAETGDRWTVDDWEADQSEVDDLLGVIGELVSNQIASRNPTNHEDLGVAEADRTITVQTEDGESREFHLGNRDNASGGYFVRSPGDDRTFILVSPAGGYLSRDRDGWRPRDIVALPEGSIGEVLLRRGEQRVRLEKDGEEWRLATAVDGGPWGPSEVPDESAVNALVSSLGALFATGFPEDDVAREADFSESTVTLDVHQGEPMLSLRFLEEEDGTWLVARAASPEPGAALVSEVYQLTSYSFDRLFPEEIIPVDDAEPEAAETDDEGG